MVWTVANQGTGELGGTWWDYVFLSSDETLDRHDVLLGSERTGGILSVGGVSEPLSTTVTFPD